MMDVQDEEQQEDTAPSSSDHEDDHEEDGPHADQQKQQGGDQPSASGRSEAPSATAADLLTQIAAEAPKLFASQHKQVLAALLHDDLVSQSVAAQVLAACGGALRGAMGGGAANAMGGPSTGPLSDATNKSNKNSNSSSIASNKAVMQRLAVMAAGGLAARRHPKAATYAVEAMVQLVGAEHAAQQLKCVLECRG